MKNIKLSTVLLFLSFIIQSGLPIKTFAQENDSIELIELTDSTFWNIFQGTPDQKDTLHECKLDFEFELKAVKRNSWTGRIRYTGYPIFIKSNSWVKENGKNERSRKYIQTVVEITELYGLKLSDYFSLNHFNNLESFTEDYYLKCNEYKELTLNQIKEFDKESNFGHDESVVEKWFLSTLKKKEPYKDIIR